MLVSIVALCVHMHTVIPDQAFLRKGRETGITYVYGHPFEHEIMTARRPASLVVAGPGGTVEDLLPRLEKAGPGYRVLFTPKERGDHYLILRAPPAVEDGAVHRAAAKVILHVQSQQGWNRAPGAGLDIVPLIRPYGLAAGSVFRGRVLFNGEPVTGATVEVEKYNPAAPASLPDDAFITGVSVTDGAGTFVANLPEPGWWCVSATVARGTERHEGTELPVEHVLTFWFPVGGK
jgi:cobalt/nickel transport protein